MELLYFIAVVVFIIAVSWHSYLYWGVVLTFFDENGVKRCYGFAGRPNSTADFKLYFRLLGEQGDRSRVKSMKWKLGICWGSVLLCGLIYLYSLTEVSPG